MLHTLHILIVTETNYSFWYYCRYEILEAISLPFFLPPSHRLSLSIITYILFHIISILVSVLVCVCCV